MSVKNNRTDMFTEVRTARFISGIDFDFAASKSVKKYDARTRMLAARKQVTGKKNKVNEAKCVPDMECVGYNHV